MTTFFTADQHLGHANIIRFCDRPFGSLDEMNETLIERWNARVADADTVVVLGDICLGRKEVTLPMVQRLRGTKHLLPGNHDRVWPGHADWRDWLARYEAAGLRVIEMLPPTRSLPVRLGERTVQMSHFPRLSSGETALKHEDWRPTDPGWLLHGHTHSPARQVGDQVNVGVDAWDFAPVAEEEILALIR